MNIHEVLDKLEHVTEKADGQYMACCPAHEDRNPSLSIRQDGEKVLMNCFAGCHYSEIQDALGISNPPRATISKPRVEFGKITGTTALVADKSPQNGHIKQNGQPKRGKNRDKKLDFIKPVATFNYHDADGTPLYQVVRLRVVDDPEDDKHFLQRKLKADGDWDYKVGDIPKVLYRLPELLESNGLVLIAEGEKDVEALRELGFTATCNVGGAGNWTDDYSKSLESRDVVIFQDNDDGGLLYTKSVAEVLRGVARSIRVVKFEEMPPKSDVSDWLAQGKSAEDLRQLIDSAAEVEIPEADSRDQVDPFVPFPVDALPDPLMRFVTEGAEAIGCDPAYVALPLLSALGSAVGNSRQLFVKNSWLVPTIIWTAIIGESGTSKTPAFRLVMKPVRKRQSEMFKDYKKKKEDYDRQKEDFESELADWKKSRKKNRELPRPEEPVEPVHERIETSDTTIEGLVPILKQNPRGLLVERDELAGWFGSFDRYASKGQSDSSNWLSMFNAEPIIVDRKTTGLIHVESAYVCVTGGIQPGIMSRSLTDENKQSGIAARILMAYPPRKARTWSEADISQATEDEIDALFESLYELQPGVNEEGDSRPMVVGMSPAAKKVWIKFYNEHNLEQVETEGEIAAAYSKLEEYPLRFALLFHLVKQSIGDSAESTLQTETVESGIAIANWFKLEAKRVYAILSESEESAYARQLFEWIERKGGSVTAREIQQGRKEIKTAEEARLALDKLAKLGLGRWEKSDGGRVGQPTKFFTTKAKPKGPVYGIRKNTVKNGVKNNTVDCRPVDLWKNAFLNSDPNDSDSDGSILI